MKTPTSVLLIFLAFSTYASAASSRGNEVLETEQARVAALITDNHAALDRLLSDDLTYTHSNASVDTKSAFMQSLISGRLKYKSLEHRDQHVRVYGDTAVLTGKTRVHSVLDGNDIHITLQFTIVYVVQEKQWRMVAWQSTRIPD